MGNVLAREVHPVGGSFRVQAQNIHADFFHCQVEVNTRARIRFDGEFLREPEEAHGNLDFMDTM